MIKGRGYDAGFLKKFVKKQIYSLRADQETYIDHLRKGVHIGNNCIIGANSLVNKDVPDGWVAAGNPAKPIVKVEEYYQKRKAAQLVEAEELYRCYVRGFHKEPPAEAFDEFFWLFQKRDETHEFSEKKMRLLGNYEETRYLFESTEPMFDGYGAFLDWLRGRV